MSWFLLLKSLHVLSAIVAVGANITYGVWSALAKKEPAHLAFALRGIKLIDDRVANPAHGVLLATGLIMAFTTYTITLTWILIGLGAYVVTAGADKLIAALSVIPPSCRYDSAVAEHDPQAFSDLFASEPDPPAQGEVGEWLARYARLVDMLERQLEETRRFADSVPEAMRQYLATENGKILTEELAIFRDRLAHWRALAEGHRQPAGAS